MKFFKIRAETEKETASEEDALLRASLDNTVIGKEEAMNIPALAACIRKISESIGSIPIKLYKIDGNAKEEIEDERVFLLNNDTGDTLSGTEFKRAIVRDYFLGKGGYAYIRKTGNCVQSIHYVKENEISFMFNSDPIFKDYDIMVQGGRYKPHDFFKVLRNTENGWQGKSIIEEHRSILSVAYHSLKYEENLVKTGGNKKGFIKAPKKLSEPAMDALKSAWRRLYQNNNENVVILNEGLDFKESSNTSVEIQLNENKKTNSDEICKLFNMPPKMINGGATEEDKTSYFQNCIYPVLNEIECCLNRDLLLEKEKRSYFFAFDITELTKGDIEKRYRAYEIASKNGFMQTDEIRFKENLPKLGLNFIKLGLQDVLYDTESGNIYIPNMNAKSNLAETETTWKGGEDDENRNTK